MKADNRSGFHYKRSEKTSSKVSGMHRKVDTKTLNKVFSDSWPTDYIIEIDNSRIQDFTLSPQITNSQKSKHAKITRSTVLAVICVKWLSQEGTLT